LGSLFYLRIMVGTTRSSSSRKSYENSHTVRKACEFLLSIQRKSGGWGESYLSCPKKEYIPLENNKTNLVQTGWALMALIHGGQEITGAFMRSCMIHYAAYRNAFPLWALAEYRRKVLTPS
ncbi:hypothetical protein MKW92_051673, partial [Papaver armeniacum]